MKTNSCFQKNGIWYFRKKIPYQLNKKTPIFRISLMKLLSKKGYYKHLFNSSLFFIISYIDNKIELLFLTRESLTLKELNEYVIGLLQRYENEALNQDNHYIKDMGSRRADIENKRYEALAYYDDLGVKFGGHTETALKKELSELEEAFNKDNIGLYRKKADDILKRQDIIKADEIEKIPDDMLPIFSENLVKKEIEVIRADIEKYQKLMGKKESLANLGSIEDFITQYPQLKNIIYPKSDEDNWDFLIEKFLSYKNQKTQVNSIRGNKTDLQQFCSLMLGDEKFGVPKRKIMDCRLEDIEALKRLYTQIPVVQHQDLTNWREKGMIYIINFTKNDVEKYKKPVLSGLQGKIKTIKRFLKDIKLYDPEKYGKLNLELWDKLSVEYKDLTLEAQILTDKNKKTYLSSEILNNFLKDRYKKEENDRGQTERNFTRHTKASPHIFWSVVLAIFTGARGGELAQIRVKDFKKSIVNDELIHSLTLRITDKEKQSLKNEHSSRTIPITNFLIDLGFLNFIQERIDNKADFVFDLKVNKDGDRKDFPLSFNQEIKVYVKDNYSDIYEDYKLPAYHDLRAYFVGKFLNGENDNTNKLLQLKQLIGHTTKDLHKDITIHHYFREPIEILKAKELIENLDFGIEEGYAILKERMNIKYNFQILRELDI
ncbi:site-specific integrase [Aliarcobacter cryaerophilus]|uniref:hypothetical protein n=1 Tax=Aliarcobacter cryaerophilus TaxID=28198 RepID=UPI000832142E|nr:hypothetical protein [Aliarcobacter cryaerophilus]